MFHFQSTPCCCIDTFTFSLPNPNVKEVPAEISFQKFRPKMAFSRMRKLGAQPVVAMHLANQSTPSSERTRKPVLTDLITMCINKCKF